LPIATLHGTNVGLNPGKPEALPPPTVIERKQYCEPAGIQQNSYIGLSKTKLAKRYGFKKPCDSEPACTCSV